MNKITVGIITALLLAFGGFLAFNIIEGRKTAVDFASYDYNSIIPGNKDNGNIGDHIRGNKTAKVLLFEYADFQCPGCAGINPRMKKLLAEYGDKIGIVYRNIVLSYHPNSQAATTAAEAAGLQGYWEKYADLLFANQATWQDIEAKDRIRVFTDLFRAASDDKGDVAKFQADMTSKDIKRKIDFDRGISEKINIPGTPSIYLNGKRIDFSGTNGEEEFLNLFRTKINERLKELGV